MSKKSKLGIFNIGLGTIIFILVFIYLAYHVFTYIASDNVYIYSIGEPSKLEENKTYTGLIIRDEELVTTDAAGLVNYYVKNCGRVGINDVVYSIDENGDFNNTLSSGNGESGLGKDDLADISKDLSRFTLSYDSSNYSDVYNFKQNLSGKLIDFLNINDAASLDTLDIDTRYFHTYKPSKTGIITYYSDGFENFDVSTITSDTYNTENYIKTSFKGKKNVGIGDVVYKNISSESWSVIIPISEDYATSNEKTSRVKVLFNESGLSTTCLYEQFLGADNKNYAKLTLTKYMIQYADSRFLTLTIINDSAEGIKIPISAVISKDFYIVPVSYYNNIDPANTGFTITKSTASGQINTIEDLDYSFKDDEYYYFSEDSIEAGTTIISPTGKESYTILEKKPLNGVYNINKGYALFKPISIIDNNSNYYIAESGLNNSISVYDNILLDASNYIEGQKIY